MSQSDNNPGQVLFRATQVVWRKFKPSEMKVVTSVVAWTNDDHRNRNLEEALADGLLGTHKKSRPQDIDATIEGITILEARLVITQGCQPPAGGLWFVIAEKKPKAEKVTKGT